METACESGDSWHLGSNGASTVGINGTRPMRRATSRQEFWNWPNCSIKAGLAGAGGRQIERVVRGRAGARRLGAAFVPRRWRSFSTSNRKRGALAVVGFFEEVGEGGGFGGHAVGDFLGGHVGATGVFLDTLPLRSGGTNLRGDGVEILDLVDGGNDGAGFNHFDGGKIFDEKRRDGEQRAHGAGGDEESGFEVAERALVAGINEIGEGEEDGIAQEETATWHQFGIGRVTHDGQIRGKPGTEFKVGEWQRELADMSAPLPDRGCVPQRDQPQQPYKSRWPG